ncbi:MAG: hypothetical protein ACP5KA_07280 [Desulfurococcaceae archaeon]
MRYCLFKTMHEYRASYALLFLTGLITGLVDALVLDFTIKAFLWAFALVLALITVSYEFIVMPTPEKPLLQATLFIVLGVAALLSSHHLTWLSVSVMLGREVYDRLWLAPNVYIDLTLYNTVMLFSLASSLAYLVYINICSCEER